MSDVTIALCNHDGQVEATFWTFDGSPGVTTFTSCKACKPLAEMHREEVGPIIRAMNAVGVPPTIIHITMNGLMLRWPIE